MITIIINDAKFQVEANNTLLEIIRERNIDYIPTLCHNDQLKPYAACFLCVVEIEGFASLKPACSTFPIEGMKIKTNSPRVMESRKTNLELLLSNHRADCYPPCKLACPANVDIQGYIALCARGLYREGQKLMRETNALPLVCGKVCARPCEEACRRNYVDEPVDIKNIKRFMAEQDINDDPYMPDTAPDTGQKIAVIGSGPAGLSAAYFSRLKGHRVVIFEKLPEAGGMLRYGIPEYRLPKDDLRNEIDLILNLGIDIEFNKELGKDFTIDSLFADGYKCVFLGLGAQLGSSMGIAGEDLQGVMQGVNFLRDVNLGVAIKLPGKVCIIGGGNTAIDAARTALRLGAQSVTIVYRRTEAEMPADDEEIQDAKEEGIELKVLHNPVGYEGTNGKLTGIRLIKMELGEPDASGRRRPVPVAGSECIEPADFVIEAIGQQVDMSSLPGIDLSKWGTILTDESLFLTNREGVFAGGDAVTGPDIIINAVAHGRKAAFVMDAYVSGKPLQKEDRLGFYIRKEDFGKLSDDEFKEQPKISRNHVHKEPAFQRVESFIEVEKGFTESDVLKEAIRCMECGCQDIYECKLKEYSHTYSVDKKTYIGGNCKNKTYDSKHRYIAIDPNKCVNCGQCVRICSDVQKQNVFSLDKRGFEATPVPYGYKALDDTNCIACGMCAALCPVGAITEKLPLGKPGPFANRQTLSHCTLCGDGCSIVIETRDEHFMKVSSKTNNDTFFSNLCEKGRFGYEAFNGITGFTSPFTRHEILDKISRILVNKPLITLSPACTLEEIDLVTAYAKKNDIDLYSFTLGMDFDKIELLQKHAVSLIPANKNSAVYEEICFFGGFSEQYNSVSFRELVMNDGEQLIHAACDLSHMYLNHKHYESDYDLFEYCKTALASRKILVVFNLQNIRFSVLEKLVLLFEENNFADYFVMNNHVNYMYLLKKITGFAEIHQRINQFNSLISLNEDQLPVGMRFTEKLIFSDKQIFTHDPAAVPLKSFYQKSGTIIDQWGNRKTVMKAAKGTGFNISDFFK